jgi:cyanophycinase
VAGTSAGAAAMPETKLNSGNGDESSQISALGMAPGLGLIGGVVIDSHFAERGRFGRLIGAVTENPKNLGVGIDEDTAVFVENDHFTVLGSGGVYVLDGSKVEYSSLSEEQPEGTLSVFNVTVHVLAKGDCFDLTERRPYPAEESGKPSRTA